MSRMTTLSTSAPAATDPNKPTLRGFDGVVDYCIQALDLDEDAITERYVRSEFHAGRLAAHRIARRLYFAPADVDAWLRSKREGGDAA